MIRNALFGTTAATILALLPTTASSDQDMLHWCVNAYPQRLEWCKSQYNGSLNGSIALPQPSNATSAEVSKNNTESPPTRIADYSNLIPLLVNRPKAPPSVIRGDNLGRFGAEATEVMAALRAALAFAKLNLDEESCNEQDPDDERPRRMLCSQDFGLSTILVEQPAPGHSTDCVQATYVVENSKDLKSDLFQFGIVADQISRVLDPELNDNMRVAVFTKLGENYSASNHTEGSANGAQVRYSVTEDGGILTFTVHPLASPNKIENTLIAAGDPVLAFAKAFDQNDLVKPDPLDAPEVQNVIQERRRVARSLLQKLDIFRYDRRFHAVGFSEGHAYNSWLKELQSIQNISDETIRWASNRAGASQATLSLYNMAWEYMHNQGRDTSESIESRKSVMKFLDGG